MRKERCESLWLSDEAAIEKCLKKAGYTDIEILSVKKEYDYDGHSAKKVFVVKFIADKVGEDLAEKFRLLCESLSRAGQDEMGELEYQLAEDFDRDGCPVYTEDLYTKVVEMLAKKGII